MATVKLVNNIIFAVNKFGEVVSGNHHGPKITIECKSIMVEKGNDRGLYSKRNC